MKWKRTILFRCCAAFGLVCVVCASIAADAGGSNRAVELPPPDTPRAENVYDLVLAFDEGTVRTAKLGLLLRTRYDKGQNAAEVDSGFRVICTVP